MIPVLPASPVSLADPIDHAVPETALDAADEDVSALPPSSYSSSATCV